MSQNSLHKISLVAGLGLSALALALSFSNLRRTDVASAPEAVDSSEVQALRNELHSLKSELRARAAATAATQDVAGSAALPQGGPAPAAPGPKLSVKSFESQPVDRKWAASAENDVRDFFRDQSAIKLQKIECRSQSCRVRFDTSDQDSIRKLMMESPSELSALAVTGGVVRGADGKPNGFEATFVMREES